MDVKRSVLRTLTVYALVVTIPLALMIVGSIWLVSGAEGLSSAGAARAYKVQSGVPARWPQTGGRNTTFQIVKGRPRGTRERSRVTFVRAVLRLSIISHHAIALL